MNQEKFAAFRPALQSLIHRALLKEGVIEVHESVHVPLYIKSDTAVQLELSEVPFVELPEDLDLKCATEVTRLPFKNRSHTAFRRLVTLGVVARCSRAGMLKRYGHKVGAKALENARRIIKEAGLASLAVPIIVGPEERKVLFQARTLSVFEPSWNLEKKFSTIGDLVQASRSEVIKALESYLSSTKMGYTVEELLDRVTEQMKAYGLSMQA